jgi:hypothetical protein
MTETTISKRSVLGKAVQLCPLRRIAVWFRCSEIRSIFAVCPSAAKQGELRIQDAR